MEALEELKYQQGPVRALALAIHEQKLRAERRRQSGPGGLLHFIRYFWREVEPDRPFVEGWILEAMCLHLEAVADGRIIRLLINVPPGSMKSLLCSVFFPAWMWGPKDRASNRYLNFSYAAHLTERDNERMMQIIKSPRFQELWGSRREKVWDEKRGRSVIVDKGFRLTADGKTKPATNRTGWKFATSVGGVGTGERGDGVILDDPHSIKDDNSEVVRPETVRWFKEAMGNRLNDMSKSFIIVIMQRTHEADVAGTIIEEQSHLYTHLNVPMEFEADNRCITRDRYGVELWRDPRTEDGELMWPERFGPDDIEMCKAAGEHAWVSQYQQRPEPRGGAIIKRAYWKPYICKRDGRGREVWPTFEWTVASVDSAFTEKKENDPAGFTIWGVFQNDEGSMCALLKQAWRKHLTLSGMARRKRKDETWADYAAETQSEWGLSQWMRYECHRHRVDELLIEGKASGIDLFNELRRDAKFDPWTARLIDPKNLDKHARAWRVQPVFAEGLIYAMLDKKYAKLAIDEMAVFPRGKRDDITDSATQAIHDMRRRGFLEHVFNAQERDRREAERVGKQGAKGGQAEPVYPV